MCRGCDCVGHPDSPHAHGENPPVIRVGEAYEEVNLETRPECIWCGKSPIHREETLALQDAQGTTCSEKRQKLNPLATPKSHKTLERNYLPEKS